jgi:hypothetical protein
VTVGVAVAFFVTFAVAFAVTFTVVLTVGTLVIGATAVTTSEGVLVASTVVAGIVPVGEEVVWFVGGI